MEIQGFPNYLIFSDGRVFSKKRNIFMTSNKRNDGYTKIEISGIKHYIHRLIALHYIPNPENKPQVDHINRDRSDNRIENLRWATRKENCSNKGINKMSSKNTSGYRYITWNIRQKKWIYQRNGYAKRFKSKIDCICYKFIHLLRVLVLVRHNLQRCI